MIAAGWALVAFVVAIGPLAVQKKALGPYFGPSGYWYAACYLTRSPPLLIPIKGAGSQSGILPHKCAWNTCS